MIGSDQANGDTWQCIVPGNRLLRVVKCMYYSHTKHALAYALAMC